MFVKFKTLRFRNILSYGSKVTEFDFENGLHSIFGSNGNGKSTFLDALSYCLYGTPYRKIKIAQLINRVNKKNLWTECEFEIGNDTYTVTRSLKPDNLSIKKNGDDLELLSTKKLNQEEINRILGIDYALFRQIICLAVNYNKPFLSLKSNEKRDIIESIFNIKIFGLMSKNLQLEQKGLKTQSTINQKSLNLMENSIRDLKRNIKELNVGIRDFEKNKQHDIKIIKSEIKKYKDVIKSSKNKIDIGNKAVAKIEVGDIESLSAMQISVDKEISVNEYRKEKALKDLESLNDVDNCPLCGSDISDEHREKHITTINEKIVSINSDIETKTTERDKLQEQIDFENTKVEKIDLILDKIKVNQKKIDDTEITLKHKKEQLKKTEERKQTIEISNFEKEYETKKDEYTNLFRKTKKLNGDIVVNDVVNNILSENGIKAHFFRKLLPILNDKINEYLGKFELPIVIKFNELMDEKITSISGRTELPYMGFSEGEKKRIDVSILLSFIETTKAISNWDSNIIIFDELFDSATDTDGLDKIIHTIRSMTFENRNKSVYIISHRPIDDEIFVSKIECRKVNNFSKITVTDS